MSSSRTKVAVFFGGRSPESDVSIVTALQALQAIDSQRYEAFPVYLAHNGKWYVGSALYNQKNYIPEDPEALGLQSVFLQTSLCNSSSPKGRLISTAPSWKRFYQRMPSSYDFDIALIACHGSVGEDGQLQGLFETAQVPYTGLRTLGCALAMNKDLCKQALSKSQVRCLPHVKISRPTTGRLISLDTLSTIVQALSFPMCVKPCHLGSSIGVGRANNLQDLQDLLSLIFPYDYEAIVEPFMEDIVEYNIAILHQRKSQKVCCSSIEEPKRHSELLDFKEKYLNGDKLNPSKKISAPVPQEGMLGMTRTLNPSISLELESTIRAWAQEIFLSICPWGAPRLDFIYHQTSKQLYFNEINPCPGSFGHYLWSQSEHKMTFTDILNHLLQEALEASTLNLPMQDPVPTEARLFKRTN